MRWPLRNLNGSGSFAFDTAFAKLGTIPRLQPLPLSSFHPPVDGGVLGPPPPPPFGVPPLTAGPPPEPPPPFAGALPPVVPPFAVTGAPPVVPPFAVTGAPPVVPPFAVTGAPPVVPPFAVTGAPPVLDFAPPVAAPPEPPTGPGVAGGLPLVSSELHAARRPAAAPAAPNARSFRRVSEPRDSSCAVFVESLSERLLIGPLAAVRAER